MLCPTVVHPAIQLLHGLCLISHLLKVITRARNAQRVLTVGWASLGAVKKERKKER